MSHSYDRIPSNGAEDSLIDQDNLIQPDDMGSQPYVVPSTAHETTPAPPVIKPQLPLDTNSHMFQINFYRRFFDLDTETFFQKIQQAANPLNTSFSNSADEGNDSIELYGFIWITGTLIFLMFLSSTGANILSQWLHSDKGLQYEYSFELLTLSISLFYGYNLIVPVLLYLGTRFITKFPEPYTLINVISIFGYTNLLWFPLTVVNFVIVIFINGQTHQSLLNILEWVAVLITGALTGLNNISKVLPLTKKNCMLINEGNPEAANRAVYVILAMLALVHLSFTVLVKITFFGISA
ncbi:uncharacterized protein CANTADRAFT_26941 [Suhomyces tanzawaensis NRRL Y-17324]|uniref:Protein YIP n=1 Tax=Suhomyces tanzawaensis NRRL Y-17324 TaxID=984487 RepID=A0A1E4SEQ3_9ASCO|nr:uncharacterized protein CANTADRAFT_26941 [Suhomyces tanzawaensis NRRL Y-17324]ODV77963.1 hypothetical protein CANTADRAFT_26941 [Suhomyces tanzawaensis NRRL Y-17324]